MAKAKDVEPTRHQLTETRGKDKLTWFSVAEPVSLEPGEAFNIVPGPQGKGFVLTVINLEHIKT